MHKLTETLKNGLTCSIDWLSFTITQYEDLSSVLAMFGFEKGDFIESPKGASGYKKMLMLIGSTLRILYDGNENMGIHFDVTGSAVGDLFNHYRELHAVPTPFGTKAHDVDAQLASDLLSMILSVGHITRIDLAIDNTGRIYYRLPELVNVLNSGRFVSKFRSWRDIIEKETSGEIVGHTIYMGSRSSNIMLRIYDKQLEQNRKLKAQGAELLSYEWVRWELELKDERADMAVRRLLEGDSVGNVTMGILENYFRIIVFDDSNKSRCSLDIKWQRFAGDVSMLRLCLEKLESSLEEKKNWIVRQVAPTLAGLIIANYGDISFLLNNLDLHAGRMSNRLRSMVTQAHPGWEKCLEAFCV